MAPKAIDARKRFNRNNRFRGHGPLLQGPTHRAWRFHRGIYKGPSPCSYSTRPAAAGHRPERRPWAPPTRSNPSYGFANASANAATDRSTSRSKLSVRCADIRMRRDRPSAGLSTSSRYPSSIARFTYFIAVCTPTPFT
jgi:hypothetical protein